VGRLSVEWNAHAHCAIRDSFGVYRYAGYHSILRVYDKLCLYRLRLYLWRLGKLSVERRAVSVCGFRNAIRLYRYSDGNAELRLHDGNNGNDKYNRADLCFHLHRVEFLPIEWYADAIGRFRNAVGVHWESDDVSILHLHIERRENDDGVFMFVRVFRMGELFVERHSNENGYFLYAVRLCGESGRVSVLYVFDDDFERASRLFLHL